VGSLRLLLLLGRGLLRHQLLVGLGFLLGRVVLGLHGVVELAHKGSRVAVLHVGRHHVRGHLAVVLLVERHLHWLRSQVLVRVEAAERHDVGQTRNLDHGSVVLRLVEVVGLGLRRHQLVAFSGL